MQALPLRDAGDVQIQNPLELLRPRGSGVTGPNRRLEAVRALLAEKNCGAFVVRGAANVKYLTRFDDVWDDEPFSLLFVTASEAVVLTDSRYSESARRAAEGSEWGVEQCIGDLWVSAVARATEQGVQRIAIESSVSYSTVERVRGLSSVEIVPASGLVEGVRAVKEPNEIERITAAQALTDDAFDHILGFVGAGMTEVQIALELEFYMRTRGSVGVAFAPIVASGPNSALPHAHPGARTLARGDFLKMDFGARAGGYCSDMTRTVVVGHASARQRKIYEAVLSANLAGIQAVRPGLPGCEIDGVARAVIEAAGFAENFGHGLGHGVGLEVHELPGVGVRSVEPVPLSSVITIEPGVYVPGYGGVRIEDLVVVEEAGARVLTHSTKELIEI